MRRRTFIAGTIAGAGPLAGCSSPSESTNNSASGDGTETDTSTEDRSYTVEMAPAGEVEFDSPPEEVAHFFPGYGDMAVALGHGDSIVSMGWKPRYHTSHYDELDGVSVDKESMTQLQTRSGLDMEIFFEVNSDLHMIDPEWLINNDYFGMEASDIEEISQTVAPFLGNTIFRRTDRWHDYRYYTMYEAFEKVAEVYQEQATYEAFKEFHDATLQRVQSKLPPEAERPNALLCWSGVNEPVRFYPYRITDEGTNKKVFHDLGTRDALEGTDVEGLSESQRGMIDYETILEIDPDTILLRGHEDKSREKFLNTVVTYMKNHEVASALRAVQEDRVFRGGPIYSGPLHHLFLLERYANLYFPERFSGELFDRDELAGIVTR